MDDIAREKLPLQPQLTRGHPVRNANPNLPSPNVARTIKAAIIAMICSPIP
jgi:hypothetical protein